MLDLDGNKSTSVFDPCTQTTYKSTSSNIYYAENLHKDTIKYKVLRYIGHSDPNDYTSNPNWTNHYHKNGCEIWWDNPPVGWVNHNGGGIPNWIVETLTPKQLSDKIAKYRYPNLYYKDNPEFHEKAFSDLKTNFVDSKYATSKNTWFDNIILEDDFGNSGMNVYVRQNPRPPCTISDNCTECTCHGKTCFS